MGMASWPDIFSTYIIILILQKVSDTLKMEDKLGEVLIQVMLYGFLSFTKLKLITAFPRER